MKYRTRKTKNEIAILKNDKNWSSLPVASETKDSEKTDSATPARAKTPSADSYTQLTLTTILHV